MKTPVLVMMLVAGTAVFACEPDWGTLVRSKVGPAEAAMR